MIRNLKCEKGSITIFALASCLFFLVSIVGVQIYTKNKQIALEENYKQIKQSYEKDVGSEENIYNSLKNLENAGEIRIYFDTQEAYIIPTESTSQTVTISQKFTVNNGTNKKIQSISYGWSNTKDKEPDSWIELPVDSLSQIVQKKDASEGDYYLHVKVVDEKLNTIEKEMGVQDDYGDLVQPINVYKSEISITNEGSNVKIIYPNETTMYNKKVGQGVSESEAKENLKYNNDTSITIETPASSIYVEATDSHGNKIYRTLNT